MNRRPEPAPPRSVVELVAENLGRSGAHVESLDARNLAVTLGDGRRCLIQVDPFEECPQCGTALESGACTNPFCRDWRFGEEFDSVTATERMNLNPDPLQVVSVQTCQSCRKRAPWCSCGAADYA